MVTNTKNRSLLLLLSLAITCQVANGEKCDISKNNIDSLRQKMSAAVTLEAKGEYLEAISLLENVKASGCWDPIHYVFLGQLYMETGQYPDAIQQLEAAELGGIKDIDLYTMLAKSYLKIGKNQRAIASLTKGINIRSDETNTVLGNSASGVVDPAISDLYAQRAIVYSSQGNNKLAIKDLHAAVQINPNNTKARAQLNKLINKTK